MDNAALRRRFVKDYSLPIQLVDEPYFSYLIDLLDPTHNTKALYAQFLKAVDDLGEDGLSRAFENALNVIKSAVESHPSYARLAEARPDLEVPPAYNALRTSSVYNADNLGKGLIAVDLVKANFQSFRRFDPDLVRNAASYEDFVASFPGIPDYVVRSKKLRQVLFGNMLPKKQQAIQKLMMGEVHAALIAQPDIAGAFTFFNVSSDEMLLVARTPAEAQALLPVVRAIVDSVGVTAKTEAFSLTRLGDQNMWVKETEDGPVFKCVPSYVMAQAIRKYRGEAPTDMDLVFVHEGHLARYMAPVFG